MFSVHTLTTAGGARRGGAGRMELVLVQHSYSGGCGMVERHLLWMSVESSVSKWCSLDCYCKHAFALEAPWGPSFVC